jgi:hypothetical protein
MNKSWTVDVKTNEDGERYIEFTDEMLEGSNLSVGDAVEWVDNQDGSFTLQKKETEWVLVEAISQYRMRYMVQVPKGKSEWALDTVVCNEAKEFSQEHLGETIFSHRVMNLDKALELCDNDNSYGKAWDVDTKLKNFFTFVKEDYDV